MPRMQYRLLKLRALEHFYVSGKLSESHPTRPQPQVSAHPYYFHINAYHNNFIFRTFK